MKLSIGNNSGSPALEMEGAGHAGHVTSSQGGGSPPLRWAVNQALRRSWLLVLGMVALLYVITHLVLPGKLNGIIIAHVIVPISWLGMAGLTYYLARREGEGNLVFTKKYLFVGILVGAFQVAVLIMAGIFVGFGESPFAKNVPGMLTNFSHLASTLIGMEFTRAYVVKSLDRRKLPLAIGFLVVMYAILLIPPARYASLGDTEVTMRFVGRFIMPSLSESILTTYLAFLGGPIAALAYRGVQSGFEWYSPVLPDLPWTAYLFIGTIPAMLGYLIVQGLTTPAQQAVATVAEATVSRKAASFGRILMAGATGCVAVLLAAIILLNTGFMGFRSMVVISPSMSPAINVGDMVITRTTDTEDLKVGDIVRYRKSRLNVIHRITTVEQTAAGAVLTTKGDANNTVDQPSPKAEDITGKAVMRLPKLGWITIWFRQPQQGT